MRKILSCLGLALLAVGTFVTTRYALLIQPAQAEPCCQASASTHLETTVRAVEELPGPSPRPATTAPLGLAGWGIRSVDAVGNRVQIVAQARWNNGVGPSQLHRWIFRLSDPSCRTVFVEREIGERTLAEAGEHGQTLLVEEVELDVQPGVYNASVSILPVDEMINDEDFVGGTVRLPGAE